MCFADGAVYGGQITIILMMVRGAGLYLFSTHRAAECIVKILQHGLIFIAIWAFCTALVAVTLMFHRKKATQI